MSEPKGQITLRPAQPEDIELLRKWDEEPHNIAADPNDDWEWETELAETPPWREQLIAELDGRPIGFLQIIDPALEVTHYWGDCPPNLRALDIWLGDAQDLGYGYGTTMMQLALARIFADPNAQGVLIDPLEENVRARRFYERFGFQAVGPRTFGLDHCMVYELRREDYERTKDTPA